MKKKLSVILFAFLFSYLFYEQSIGLNLLLYTLAVNVLLWFDFTSSFRNKDVLGLSIASVLAGIGSLMHGSDLALFGVVVLLLTLIGRLNGVRFYLYTWLTGVYSFLLSVVLVYRKKSKTSKRNPLQVLSVLVPAVLIVIFFLLYRDINPLFEALTEFISFENISWSLIGFTFLGLSIILALYDYRTFF